MVMKLDQVVPFGRRLDEYRHLFNLTDPDINHRIISVADGPASFNSEMTALGKTVVSVDPLYAFSAQQIESQFYAVVDNIINQIRATPEDWVWSYHRDVDALRESRAGALERFVADFAAGKASGRYITASLPTLPFADDSFDLALCSNFLFLYSAHLDRKFHLDSILEMLRIAPEVRIFPLLTLMLETSPYLHPVLTALEAAGYHATIEQVDFELQRGGNSMLRIRRTT